MCGWFCPHWSWFGCFVKGVVFPRIYAHIWVVNGIVFPRCLSASYMRIYGLSSVLFVRVCGGVVGGFVRVGGEDFLEKGLSFYKVWGKVFAR